MPRRSLSGIFFRYKNPETDVFEDWCFEDLPNSEQVSLLKDRSNEWLCALVMNLSQTITGFCDAIEAANPDFFTNKE